MGHFCPPGSGSRIPNPDPLIRLNPDPKHWYRTEVNIHRKKEKETAVPLKTVLQLASFLFLALQLLLGLLQAGVPVSQDQLQLRSLIVSGLTLLNQLFVELGDFVGGIRLPAGQLHILRVERVDLEAQLLLLLLLLFLDRCLLGSLQTERENQWDKYLPRRIQKAGSVSHSDPDPWSGAFLTARSGKGKKSGSGVGINIQDHFFESLQTVFGLSLMRFRIRDLFDPGSGIFLTVNPGSFDPRSRMEKFRSGIRYKHPGYATQVSHMISYVVHSSLVYRLCCPGKASSQVASLLCSAIGVTNNQCYGSMTFWYGSGSGDPCLWLMDPDPAIFVLTFKTPTENNFFSSKFFCQLRYFLNVHLSKILFIYHFETFNGLWLNFEQIRFHGPWHRSEYGKAMQIHVDPEQKQKQWIKIETPI